MFIAGVGAVTGYGWGTDKLWNGLVSGKHAASLVGGFGPDGDESAWLARIPEIDTRTESFDEVATLSGRAMHSAAREAITDAEKRGWRPGRRVGLLHAVVIPEVYEWRDFYVKDASNRGIRDYLTLMPSTAVSTLMKKYGFHGPAMNISAMCSSGNAGLVTAKMWLDAGIVDDVVFVSTDLSLTHEHVEHFVRLGVGVCDVEPLDGCRPFQEGSRGFPAGEASVGFVLSNSVDQPYMQVLGGAMSHDAHHVTSIEPSLTHVFSCVKDALDLSGVAPDEVRYINAHGPGTKQCDAAETTLLEELFDSRPNIFSIKPLTGHCQGAAAAVELAASALGAERGVIPAPPTVAPGHHRLLDGATAAEPGITVKTSLGMGGHNSAVVLATV
jgi:3-oxoacyl-[acyl-carrier-protein] synthase II